MVDITVNGAQSSFREGELKLEFFNTYVKFGDYPYQFTGPLQVLPEDGVIVSSTEEEVKNAALTKLKAMVAERN